MDQKNKQEYLIKELLKEQPEYEKMRIPKDGTEQKQLLRSLFNIRMPMDINEDFLKIQDEYLQAETIEKGITELASLTQIENELYLWQGDITTLKVDAIVNAANL